MCQEREHLIPLYHHPRDPNSLELLPNGTLRYTSDHRSPMEFSYIKYCIDKLVVSHNYSHIEEGDVADFAYVCIDISQSISETVELWVLPVGIAISMACLTLTFLLYALLPQLRDLTGKFILAICAFLTTSYALRLVDTFGMRDPNVEKLATELVQHTSIVGAWLCLNTMGHHVWKVIMSKSVFTRVTDGARCCYYSIYVCASLATISSLAIGVHFLVENGTGVRRFRIGYITLAIFYAPVALLLLANLFFYWNCQQQIGKQLVYNRSMQHFQVNFDLYSKLLMVVGSCWLFQTLALLDIPALYYIGMVFAIIQGPLIFLVAMCRTRVAFLFKKYFCKDGCCVCLFGTNSDFIELASTELATVDKMRDKMADEAEQRSLLDRWGDANSKDRELSKSLFNVRPSRAEGQGNETPLMKMGRMLKSNSVNLATLNFGWRRETAV